eukprot:14080813-Alexandrium_andersonii.AAC.1
MPLRGNVGRREVASQVALSDRSRPWCGVHVGWAGALMGAPMILCEAGPPLSAGLVSYGWLSLIHISEPTRLALI